MASGGNVKFRIEGIDEVKKMLDALPKEISDKVQLSINKEAGKIAKKVLQEAAPEGDNDKASADKAANNVLVSRGDKKTNVFVGFAKKVWYIKLIERGTKVRKTESGAERGSITRKPFIDEAHRKAVPKILQYLEDNYLKIINRTLKRLAKKVR